MGRPRKHPQKSPGSAAPIGRPRVYPIKEPGPKRPLGRPRKVIQASVPEVNRPRGRPRLSKTSTTEEYTTESSEDEYSHADTNEEDDDERLARVMTKSPYLRNEEDFILSDTDSSDEIDPETKKMALADAREDSPFEEKLMYDTRTKTYYVKDVAEKRHNIGGLGFKETVSMPTIKSGKKHSSRDTEGYPSILLENETSGPFPIFDSNYRLTHILRGPSKILFPNRDGTKDTDIWAVEFEPGIDKVSSNIAAVCGGDTVELIDAGLGRVIKRYSHVENKEEFYCLAWTTLACMDAWAQEKPYNILAAAGVLGTIKLFNPTQSECYRYLFGHSKEISRLVFSKTKPRWLLSASGDMTVRLWDIGSPESKLDTSICLARFNLKNAEIPTALCMSNDMKWLFIGCDTGKMYRYSLGALTINRLRSAKMAAMIKFKPGHKRRGQGMVQFGSPMAEYPVSQEWHESYVDDILMIEKLGNDRTIFQCVISRASSDEEFIMWNPVKSTRKDADILTSYEWPESPASCLRMKLYEAAGKQHG
ncbi:WD40-repeat-containing domain protein [Umbelopsis sp. PMI_123]|nr:WD40-repeat-containing domain protein [Umbelopsis sp. PMI_123]